MCHFLSAYIFDLGLYTTSSGIHHMYIHVYSGLYHAYKTVRPQCLVIIKLPKAFSLRLLDEQWSYTFKGKVKQQAL